MIFIGIDPGANKTGYVIQWLPGNLEPPIAIGECPIYELKSVLRGIDYNLQKGEKVIVFIEHWKTTFRRAGAHQSHVKQIRKIIREIWPRKNVIIPVDPKTWQTGMLKGLVGTTKERSLQRAGMDGFETESHNIADAINVLNFGLLNRLHEAKRGSK